MTKSDEQVIKEFQSGSRRRRASERRMLTPVLLCLPDYVNMSADELDEWLQTEESKSTGWTSSGEGEAVGHESGRKIVRFARRLRRIER